MYTAAIHTYIYTNMAYMEGLTKQWSGFIILLVAGEGSGLFQWL